MKLAWLLITCLLAGCNQPGPAPEVQPKTPRVAAGLNAGSTFALFGIERPHALVARMDRLFALLPESAQAEKPELLDPAARRARFGFDLSTAEGWRGAGIDPEGGFGLAFGAEFDGPVLYVRPTDLTALTATLERLGRRVEIGDETAGVTALTVDGDPMFATRRAGFAFVVAGASPAAARQTLTDFQAYPKRLAADPVFQRAHGDGMSDLAFSTYLDVAALGRFVAGGNRDVVELARFYAERFEAVAITLGADAGGARILASAKGAEALRQIFTPGTRPPRFSAHLSPTQVTLRLDLNLGEMFDGALALLPESLQQPRVMVAGARQMMPMVVGVTAEQLALALSGHFAFSIDAGADPGLQSTLVLAGVKDVQKIPGLIQAAHQAANPGAAPLTPTRLAGRDAFILPPPLELAFAWTDALLFFGPKPIVEAALTRTAALPPAVAALVDQPTALGSFVGWDRITKILRPEGAAEGAPPVAEAGWKPRLIDDYLVSRVVADGRGLHLKDEVTMLALVGVMAAIAVPAFMKYLRRAKNEEALMSLRRIFDGSVMYALDEHRGADGQVLPRHFPPSAPLTPATPACKDGRPARHVPDATTWSHPTWRALGFALDGPFAYQYEYLSDGKSFTARAIGDLNCDGVLSTFERTGTFSTEGDVVGSPGVFKRNEFD